MESNIVMISIDKLVDFSDHPYKVLDDEAMDELCESVRTVGVLVPIIVRTVVDGRYEIISGHRRKRACERAGIDTIPAVVTKLNDDEAAHSLLTVTCTGKTYFRAKRLMRIN
ncbi:MAG: ParB/RepB/Spo0J family partition protein [Clostridia bacterium]|nr:ParB/RepB/Spo0J family partition protein [Clostridia bacterium]